MWDAADFHWAYRTDQHTDDSRQVFWLEDGEPVAAIVVTDWGHDVELYVIVHPGKPEHLLAVWHEATRMLATIEAPVELALRQDQPVPMGLAAAAGFIPSDVTYSLCSQPARVAPQPPMPAGLRIVGRDEMPHTPHHLIGRNGTAVERWLQESGLYRADLDLVVRSDADEVAVRMWRRGPARD